VRIPFRLVDVFTERPLAGNQLCVVPETPTGLHPSLMQSLASEMGFSETTFVVGSFGDRYRMRIFTPGTELPFAGHPTLGTAFVMVSEGRVATPAVQEVTAGEIPVEVDVDAGFAWMQQLPPEFGPEVADRDRVARAAWLDPEDLHPDLAPQVVSTGLPQLLVPVRDESAVARAAPDPERLSSLIDEVEADGYYLFAFTDGGARARFFGPGVGVDEDPATGSAAGPLGIYVAERRAVAPARLLIRQGENMGRPSELHVDVRREGDRWSVRVGGGVRPVARGEFEVPDR
jgi:trans-2,3-dihydro-3-hydroxyanthranilate isomerase